MTDNTLKARLERCKALQGKVEAGNTLYSPTGGVDQVVEVKEGYVVECRGNYGLTDAPLSEALTLRTAEDVRREALGEAAKAVDGARCDPWATDTTLALIDNPAPKQDTRALQAEAWDEGYIASADDGCSWTAQTLNPYRKGDE